ncbi:hypothetical protein GF420_02640 [candidate division GN15 bacterium]|nr:hypothetical protein [candidate division GN15 bacterium]
MRILRDEFPSGRPEEEGTHAVHRSPIQVVRRVLAVAEMLRYGYDTLVVIVTECNDHVDNRRPLIGSIICNPVTNFVKGRASGAGGNHAANDYDSEPKRHLTPQ